MPNVLAIHQPSKAPERGLIIGALFLTFARQFRMWLAIDGELVCTSHCVHALFFVVWLIVIILLGARVMVFDVDVVISIHDRGMLLLSVNIHVLIINYYFMLLSC